MNEILPLERLSPNHPQYRVHINCYAQHILQQGSFFELLTLLLERAGIIGVTDVVILSLTCSISTLRGEKARKHPILLISATSTGKSVVMNALEELLPLGSVVRRDSITPADLKRKGDEWANSIILIDEFSAWMANPTLMDILKKVITSSRYSYSTSVQEKGSQWSSKEFILDCSFTVIANATEESLQQHLHHQESEIRSRFLEIPLPADPTYIRKVREAAMTQLEPSPLAEERTLLDILQECLTLASVIEVPPVQSDLLETINSLIKSNNPLSVRLCKRLSVMLENTAILLGKKEIDLETYTFLYPMIEKVFSRTLSTSSDALLGKFETLRHGLGDDEIFNWHRVKEVLGDSKATVYRLLEEWQSSGWVVNTARGKYQVTQKGKVAATPSVLPNPKEVAAVMFD